MLLDESYYENFANQRVCNVCEGSGEVDANVCDVCNGKGTVADNFDHSDPNTEFFLSTVLYRPEEYPLHFTSARRYVMDYIEGAIEKTYHLSLEEFMELVPADAIVLVEIGKKRLENEVAELDKLNHDADLSLRGMNKQFANMQDLKDFKL